MAAHRGAGDRWLAGERVEGVTYGPRAAVALAHGARAGEPGVVLLLTALEPEATYLVRLAAGDEIRVRQSALLPAS